MSKVSETPLPGVGVRYDFTTASGQAIGVISHRSGRYELLIYDVEDPDACSEVVHLDDEDTHTLAELLGGAALSERLGELQQRVAGLAIDWVPVASTSPCVGRTLADLEVRERTGATIVAAIRGDTPVAAPTADFVVDAGDTLVAVGTSAAVKQLVSLLRTG